MPYSIQVHHNYHKASSEAGAFNMLSVHGMRSTTDSETLIKDPKLVFQFVKDKINSVNGDKYVHTAKSSPCELKHMAGIFMNVTL